MAEEFNERFYSIPKNAQGTILTDNFYRYKFIGVKGNCEVFMG